MDFPTYSTKVSRGLTYSYVHVSPASADAPYILFLHGFPSLPADYHKQITHFSKLGYGIVVPELLGYGDTSHPVQSDAYRLKLMSQDVIDLLDHLSVPIVIGVGHDWGSTLMTRVEFYHPDRISRIALIAIGPSPIGQPFEVDAVNSMMKENLGYEGFGYMVFLARDPDAADIINGHQSSFRSLVYTPDRELWIQHLCPIGALKQWLLDDRKVDASQTGLEDQLDKVHQAAFSIEKGGYAGTTNWYKNHVFGKNTPDEQAELQRRGLESYHPTKPFLQILAANDPIALANVHEEMTRTYAPQATIKTAKAAHWAMLEAADYVNKELEAFFALP